MPHSVKWTQPINLIGIFLADNSANEIITVQ
jgi:hypothetical protein